MMKYKYIGTATTGVTLEVNGEILEVMLFPGCRTELPEEHPWVKRMLRRGFLAPEPAENPPRFQTAEPAERAERDELPERKEA